jgi:hypothetical protein
VRHARDIESGELGEALLRQLDARVAPRARLGRELALERRLQLRLALAEIARGGSLVGVAAQPFVGEAAEEIRERALGRQRRAGGKREKD